MNSLRHPIVLAVVSGLLVVMAFPFQVGEHLALPRVIQGITAWFAFVPLMLALEGVSPGRGAFLTWVAATLSFIGTLFWVVVAMTTHGHIPWPLALLALALLGAFIALQHSLGAYLALKITHRWGFSPALTLALTWTGVEYVRNYIFSGFPWSNVAYSQAPWLPVIQVVDITGIYGVTFLILLVNASLANLWQGRRSRSWGKLSLAGPLALILCVIYGQVRISTLDAEGGKPLTVALLQGNIPQDQKWDKAFLDSILATYRAQGAAAEREGAQLVVWPEAAVPVALPLEITSMPGVLFTTATGKAFHLMGAPTSEEGPERTYFLRNSAFLVGPDRSIVGRYDKSHLVPFGEYIPLKPLFFFLDKLVQMVGDFVPGTPGTPLNDGQHKYGVLICYEDIFPEISRAFARGGAEVLVNITNDAWYGWSSALAQHRDMVVFRAIETRLPVARVANTGISAFVDPTGRLQDETGMYEAEVVVRDIIPRQASGLYLHIGDTFAVGLWIVILTLLLLPARMTASSHT